MADARDANAPGRLARDSMARLSADGLAMVAGLASGIITARWLGPGGRGVYATLSFLAFLAGGLSTFGLGEAAIVLIGGKRRSAQPVLSTTLATTLVLSLGASIAFVVGAVLLVDRAGVGGAIAAGALSIPIVGVANVLGGILNASVRIRVTSFGLGLMAVTTTVATWLLVAVLRQGITGGILAGSIGAAAGMVFCATMVRSSGIRLRPRIDRTLLGPALRFGATVQGAFLLQSLSARLDLLIVYGLMSATAAGYYSIALTLALLVAAIPTAVSYATFPRLSRLGVSDARELLLTTTRLALSAALATAALIATLAPLAIPFLFGDPFRPAVTPTVILVSGGVLYGLQWSLARGRGAQGVPGLMLASFSVSTVVMVVGDLAVIPAFGLAGAAWAAVGGSCAGVVVCLVSYRRREEIRVRDVVPRWSDLMTLARVGAGLVPTRAKTSPVILQPTREPD